MKITDWLPEFPISSEDDEDLMQYFLNTPQINQIINQNKWMVLGRKGTGKTAIYKYFQSDNYLNENPTSIVVPLNFKSYPWPIHKLYKDSMEGEISAYSKSWEYIILTQSLICLIQKYEADSFSLPKDLKKAKDIINKIYGNPFPSIVEIIKGKVARIDNLSLPSIEAGSFNVSVGEISFEELSDDKKLLTSLKTNAFTLSNYFKRVLTSSLNDKSIIIILDQLDENWLESEISEYSKILVSLINVCKELNTTNDFNKKLKCILFIRTDIYETLRFNDKNKIHQSSSIEIRWDEDSLNEMFYTRIKKYKHTSINLDDTKKSNLVFDVSYVKHGATPFKHILRYSFYRPRDIIVYFNKVRNSYTDSKSGLYSSKNLYAAQKDFSTNLYNELLDEWANCIFR